MLKEKTNPRGSILKMAIEVESSKAKLEVDESSKHSIIQLSLNGGR